MAPIEDHMVAVAKLIKEIAEAIFTVEIETPFYRYPEYHAVSRALIELEATGFVEIERWGWHRSERANRLVAVRLL